MHGIERNEAILTDGCFASVLESCFRLEKERNQSKEELEDLRGQLDRANKGKVRSCWMILMLDDVALIRADINLTQQKS